MIEVNHLVKKYGSHYAVSDLSFHVEKGQIYGFLGPNGAGKSTTMNIITGYLAPTGGEVKIGGHDIMKEPEEAKRCIGYLPELPPVYPEMTVHEYLQFAAQLKKVPGKNQKDQIEEVMKMTRILDVEKRLIKNLSKGYRQRVGLAQALIGSPEVIILDEPTVGLDPKQIIEIRDLIRSLKEKHTIILSSHILSEVSAVCDQIMIISKGELVACDTPEGLSRRMAGDAELEITVKGEQSVFQKALTEIHGISEVRISEKSQPHAADGKADTEDELTGAVIKTDNNADIREELFYCMVRNNLPIMGLNLTSKSLEDIFLELTDSEKSHSRIHEEKEDEPTEDKDMKAAEMKGAELKEEGIQREEAEHDSDL